MWILCLCVVRIQNLDPSVSCYRYRRHRTLWRQWWIWPSSLSPLPWNLTTVRLSVTAKVFVCKVRSFNRFFFVTLIPNLLSTTIRESSISKLMFMLQVCRNFSINIVLFVLFHSQVLISELHYIKFIGQYILFNLLHKKLFLSLQYLGILHTVYIYLSLDTAI